MGLFLWFVMCFLAFLGLVALIAAVSLWWAYRDMVALDKDFNQDFEL